MKVSLTRLRALRQILGRTASGAFSWQEIYYALDELISNRETRTIFHPTRPRPHTNPTITFLFKEMDRQKITLVEMEKRSGVRAHTIGDWGRRRSPGFPNLEACFNVLGYTLKPQRKE